MATLRSVILWDIDGTLVSVGGVTRRSFDLAVVSALGRAPGEHGVSFGGKTDPQIALEDTERDLACARAGGARCLLVATGLVGYADLSPFGADALLPDLSDVDAAERILTSR
jgi:phosphoglycolate phosphatase